MNNKEKAYKFLEDNKVSIDVMVKKLLSMTNYDFERRIHFLNENDEVLTTKMLEEMIGENFNDFIDFPYRQKWIITNKIYFMLLPPEERAIRLKEHKKKVNKIQIKKLNKKRQSKIKKEEQ